MTASVLTANDIEVLLKIISPAAVESADHLGLQTVASLWINLERPVHRDAELRRFAASFEELARTLLQDLNEGSDVTAAFDRQRLLVLAIGDVRISRLRSEIESTLEALARFDLSAHLGPPDWFETGLSRQESSGRPRQDWSDQFVALLVQEYRRLVAQFVATNRRDHLRLSSRNADEEHAMKRPMYRFVRTFAEAVGDGARRNGGRSFFADFVSNRGTASMIDLVQRANQVLGHSVRDSKLEK